MSKLPDYDILNKMFSYNPASGDLLCNKTLKPKGSLRRGHFWTTINYIKYKNQDLIWKMLNGQEASYIQHRNLNTSDNRLSNLSDAKYDKNMLSMKRFFSNCDVQSNGCVLWTGTIGHRGYGQFTANGVRYRAHRYSYMKANGLKELDPFSPVCHSCDNPSCVNPEHLWLGTQSENIKDCVRKKRHVNSRKTHCRHGHKLSKENTILEKNGTSRRCRICKSRDNIKYKRKVRNGIVD